MSKLFHFVIFVVLAIILIRAFTVTAQDTPDDLQEEPVLVFPYAPEEVEGVLLMCATGQQTPEVRQRWLAGDTEERPDALIEALAGLHAQYVVYINGSPYATHSDYPILALTDSSERAAERSVYIGLNDTGEFAYGYRYGATIVSAVVILDYEEVEALFDIVGNICGTVVDKSKA